MQVRVAVPPSSLFDPYTCGFSPIHSGSVISRAYGHKEVIKVLGYLVPVADVTIRPSLDEVLVEHRSHACAAPPRISGPCRDSVFCCYPHAPSQDMLWVSASSQTKIQLRHHSFPLDIAWQKQYLNITEAFNSSNECQRPPWHSVVPITHILASDLCLSKAQSSESDLGIPRNISSWVVPTSCVVRGTMLIEAISEFLQKLGVMRRGHVDPFSVGHIHVGQVPK